MNRAEKRYNDALQQSCATSIKRKIGRPSTAKYKEETAEESMLRRSQTVPYDKTLCIICQRAEGILHMVQVTSTGHNMHKVAEQLSDKSFFRRLNSISAANDATANDVQYHNLCWAKAKREAERLQAPVKEEDYLRTLLDIELIHVIDAHLSDPSGKILDMNMINEIYLNILVNNGKEKESISSNYKKYLKQLILENLPDVTFIKNKNVKKTDYLCSTKTERNAFDIGIAESTSDNLGKIWSVAKLIRKEVLEKENWVFNGSFGNFTLPPLLSTLLRWILVGPTQSIENEKRELGIEQVTSIVSQVVMQCMKSKRQVQYDSHHKKRSTVETPLNVGIGLYIHQRTRSKELIEVFSDLNLSINYDKLLSIKKDITSAVTKKMENNDGFFVPTTLSPYDPIFFAIDNTDMKIDTVDGKNQLHGTAIAVYQQQNFTYDMEKLALERRRHQPSLKKTLYNISFCPEPSRLNMQYTYYTAAVAATTMELCKDNDTIWFLMKSLNDEVAVNTPTWSAYNTIMSKIMPETSVCTLPVIQGSPTDWSNLFSALQVTENLTKTTSYGRKTVISLDLQLYSKCVQLQSRNDISEKFVFRMGELHVVFTVLKVLGKIIDGSGLDQSFEEAGIYGSTTIQQIKDGKHPYRSLEAHFTLYIALYKSYIQKLIENKPEAIGKKLHDGLVSSTVLLSCHGEYKSSDVQEIHKSLLDLLVSTKFAEIQQSFDACLTHQAKFLRNYMQLFESLLLFLRATRQQSWIYILQV